jgi:hypothetical protein
VLSPVSLSRRCSSLEQEQYCKSAGSERRAGLVVWAKIKCGLFSGARWVTHGCQMKSVSESGFCQIGCGCDV